MGLLRFLHAFNSEMSAFADLQAAKPQNPAHALADSPAGQLAWIGQMLGTAVDSDTVLTIATIYRLTNTGASSARLYYEDRHSEHPVEPTTAPTGPASFAYDFRPIRKFAERDQTLLTGVVRRKCRHSDSSYGQPGRDEALTLRLIRNLPVIAGYFRRGRGKQEFAAELVAERARIAVALRPW
jgi:hypothetical protein